MKVATKKTIYKKDYLNTLDHARVLRGLTNKEIAKKAKLHYSSISRVFRGKVTYYPSVKKICEALGIEFKTILR